MEVSHIKASRSLVLSSLDSKTALASDPYSEFKTHQVVYKKKLQPKVDIDFRLEKLGVKSISSLDTSKKGSRSKKKRKKKKKNVDKPETLEKPKKERHGKVVLLRNNHRVQHNLIKRPLPSLLLMPFKPLTNMLPTQTHDVNISSGLRDYQNGRYPSAIGKFTKALRVKPDELVPKFVRGLCWAEMGNNKKAANDFRAAQDKGNKEATYNLGLALAYCHDYDGSVEAFSEAMKRGRNTDIERDSLRNRSLILRAGGQYGECIKDLGQLKGKEDKKGTSVESSFVDSRPMSQSWESNSLSQFVAPDATERRGSSMRRVSTLRADGVSRRSTMHTSAEERAKARQKKLKEKLYGEVHMALTTPAHERSEEQLNLLTEECRMMKAFSHLDEDQVRRLWKYLRYRRFNSGVRLFEEGDEADKFYVIWSGQVSARIDKSVGAKTSSFVKTKGASLGLANEEIVNTMNVGETLGEAVDGGVRMASCVTEKVTELLVLERKGFQKTFKLFFQEQDKRKMAFLQTFPFFSRQLWDEEKLLKTAHFCRERVYRAGETIIEQGAPADGLYFIMKGMVALSREVIRVDDNGEKESICNIILTKLCSGSHFGEITVLDQENVNPTFPSKITCETKVKVLRLDKSQLDIDVFLQEGVLNALKEASYSCPDDNFILQSHIDVMRNLKRTKKVMDDLRGNLKDRGRKDTMDMEKD